VKTKEGVSVKKSRVVWTKMNRGVIYEKTSHHFLEEKKSIEVIGMDPLFITHMKRKKILTSFSFSYPSIKKNRKSLPLIF